MSVAQHILIWVLRLYRVTLSPLLGALCGGLGLGCRFTPTCSQYAMDAIRCHGVITGVAMAARRLSRCHPWGASGYDPVPQKTTPDCGCSHSAHGTRTFLKSHA